MSGGGNRAASAIEPLEPALWFERFALLGSRAQDSGLEMPEPLLRHFFHLVQLTPAPLVHLCGVQVCEASFEQLLEMEHYDCAALLLLGQGFDFAISKSVDGRAVTVTLSLADGEPESTATAGALPQAVLVAYCACMDALRDRASRILRTTDRVRQTSRSAPHRRSMTH